MSILDDILKTKAEEIEKDSQMVSLSDLEKSLPNASPVRGFQAALQDRIGRGENAIIAEIKKASPSKGLIRDAFNATEHAEDYERNGATCLSVLTDEKYFQGKKDYLVMARMASRLPVIRKDFMIDPYQVAESRAIGADCILLIVAALDPVLLSELASYAKSLSLDVLVEVHNSEELERALGLDCQLIGINNRNLHTFETSLQTTIELAAQIPGDRTIITESGIHTAEDIAFMNDNGIHGFLIGETFMRAEKPGQKLAEFLQPG